MARLSQPPLDDVGTGLGLGASALAHPVPAGMRDLLPPDAARHAQLGRRIVRTFELCAYELVTVPLFEFADVVERGLGALESHEVLRFVEPESGAVVSLRPDMTPQVARLLATRLAEAPAPARLCYQGSVLRRRHERARRHRQIPQAGIELLGSSGPEGDLEVLSVAVSALRAAGLEDFVIDLGHARIAAALVEPLAESHAREVLDALEVKGGADVWSRAERVLVGTGAEPALFELKRLWEAAGSAGLSSGILVDLGETRDFAYYTGALFQIHAEGPGRALGAGGRYDGLLERFGAARPAVGFAFGLDDVAWALEHAGRVRKLPPKLLLAANLSSLIEPLRSVGLAAAPAPSGDPLAYARAWRYSHVLEAQSDGLCLTEVESSVRESVTADPAELVPLLSARLAPGGSGKEDSCRP